MPCRELPLRAVVALALTVGALLFAGRATGQLTELPQEPSGKPHTPRNYVVLKSGSVWRGNAETEGNQVVVRLDSGAVVRLNLREVDFVSESIDDAARRVASRIPEDNLAARIKLADWCLGNGAFADAEREFIRLSRIGQLEAEVRALGQRLERARAEEASHDAAPGERPATPTPPNSTDAGLVREMPDTRLRLATHGELRAAVESLRPESRRVFSSSVHNRILAGCAAARCHSGPNDSFRLWKYTHGGGIDSTATQRNLHAILEWVDRDEPSRSRLLEYMSRAHGGQESAAFEIDSPEWSKIRAWIIATAPPAVAEQGKVAPASRNSPGSSPPVPANLHDQQLHAAKNVTPDPFDPGEFNRLYANPPAPTSSLDSSRSSRPLPPVDDDDS